MSELDIQLSEEESERRSSSLYSEDNNFNEDEYEKRRKLINNLLDDKDLNNQTDNQVEDDDLEEIRRKIKKKFDKDQQPKPQKKVNSYVPPDFIKTFIIMELCRLYNQAKKIDSDKFFAEILSYFQQETLEMIEQKIKNVSSIQEQLKILIHNFQLYYSLQDKEYYILSFLAFCNFHGLNVRLVKAIDLQLFGLEPKFQVKIKQDEIEQPEKIEKEGQVNDQSQKQDKEKEKEKEVYDINQFSYNSNSQIQQKNKYISELDQNLSKKLIKKKRSKKFNTDLFSKNNNLWMEIFIDDKWYPFDPISDHVQKIKNILLQITFDIEIIKLKIHNTSTCLILTTQEIFFKDPDLEQIINEDRIFHNYYFLDLGWKYCSDCKFLRSRLGIARWFNVFQSSADLFYESTIDLLDDYCKKFVQADRSELQEFEFKYPPKTLKEVKYNNFFAVKSQLQNYEMINSQAQSYGEVEKEQLYLKKDIIKLHSQDIWRKFLKIVKPEELAHPVKEVRGKIQKNSGEATSLYTEQQCVDINLSAKDSLPANNYNNFELNYYPPPRGTVIFPKSGFKKPLTQNKINFLEVTTGFDLKKGKMFASKQGYLIYEQDYEKVQKIYDEYSDYIRKRDKDKLRKELLQSWKDIFKQILVQKQIQQQYQQ